MSDSRIKRIGLILTASAYVILLSFSNSVFADKTVLPIKTWSTESGTKVFYVYAPELPMVDIQLVFDAGSARDGKKFGLARLANEMLGSGTKTMDADAIAAAFENVGAIYANTVNRDMAVLALRSLTEDKFLNPAVNTFTSVLTEANFPDKEFARIQKQTLNVLNKQEEEPAVIATKAFYNSLYSNFPYGHSVTGTKETVNSIAVTDLKDFYKQYYSAKNAIVSIVGAVDLDKAKMLAEQITRKLPTGDAAKSQNFTLSNTQAIEQHIPFDSTQTHILIGYLGIKHKDSNYFSALVGNTIFGGGTLTSRLFDQVREKRGLAYSVYSQFVPLKERGPFVIELQTRKEESDNAINVVNKTLRDYIQNGPTQTELDLAKKNMVRGFLLRLAGNSSIIAQLNNIAFYKLPLNYLDTYRDNVNKVTAEQIKDAFKQLLPVNKLITVTVGFNQSSQHAQK